jgi:putative ABC transport system permease protein
MSWIHRLAGSFRKTQLEERLDDELQFHIDMRTAEFLAGGMDPGEARARARRIFGNSALLKERTREMDTIRWLETLWQDLGYAVRMLRKSPGFTTVAVLSLALGIGGSAAIYSVVSAVLLRPLPFPDPDRLVQAANDGYYPPGGVVALQQRSRTMDFAGFTLGVDLNLTGQGEAWRLTGSSVSANFFTVLGVGVELGRAFRPFEDQAGRDNVVIISHAIWRDRFGADPGIIGRVITLGGVDRQIIGVMTPGFTFQGAAAEFWIPLHLDPRHLADYWAHGFMPVIARMHSGVTLAQAGSEIQSITRQMNTLFPYPMGRDWNAKITVVPLQEFLVSGIRAKLILLQCAIGLVLLISCVNVAGLLLARGTSRQKEMALRTALGAGRGRIARQLLTESVALALGGGALGIGLAMASLSALKLALPVGTAGLSGVQMSWHLVLFVSLLSVVTGLAFGLAPALSASGPDLVRVMKTGGQRSAGTTRTRVRSALVAGEVALAVVLASSAGLLIKSLWMLTQVNPGFQSQRVFTLRVSPNESLCRERASCIALYNELLLRTRGISGVYDVAAANTLPLAGNIPSIPVSVEGLPYVPADHVAPMFWAGAVTPSYFRLLHIPILAGRAFADSDAAKSARVIIVSAAMARRYWPGQNPIGKHVRPVFESDWRTVVGVAGDVRQYDVANHSPDYIAGALYMPYPQSITNERQLPAAMTLIVRTGSDPTGIPERIRELVNELNPNVPVSEIRTMESMVDESIRPSRSLMWLFVTFAGAALVLAAIGTYGVVSYTVAQKTFEIGMRVALGASRRSIFSLVLGQSLRLVVTGLVMGLATSIALTRTLSSFLYGTGPADPVTLAGVCAVLLAVAFLAGFVPAQRAARVDPLTALRVD